VMDQRECGGPPVRVQAVAASGRHSTAIAGRRATVLPCCWHYIVLLMPRIVLQYCIVLLSTAEYCPPTVWYILAWMLNVSTSKSWVRAAGRAGQGRAGQGRAGQGRNTVDEGHRGPTARHSKIIFPAAPMQETRAAKPTQPGMGSWHSPWCTPQCPSHGSLGCWRERVSFMSRSLMVMAYASANSVR
jgi:hypothetical protein